LDISFEKIRFFIAYSGLPLAPSSLGISSKHHLIDGLDVTAQLMKYTDPLGVLPTRGVFPSSLY
jgi:hypothetical protein